MATLIEPGVRYTFGPMVFTGKGPLFKTASSMRKSVSSIPRLLKSRIEIFRRRVEGLPPYQPTVNRVSRVLIHSETIFALCITNVYRNISMSIDLALIYMGSPVRQGRPRNLQKEEVHGNGFNSNFRRCGGKKLFPGCGGRFKAIFLCADFPDGWRQSFLEAGDRVMPFRQACPWLRSRFRFLRVGHRWRPQHFAGLSRKTWRLAPCAVPGSGHLDDAQVLAGAGSHDVADPNDSIYEECLHAWRRLTDFSVRSRTIQP